MEEIYRQNVKIVYCYLYSICKDEALAEELTQETFLKAISAIERYNGTCKISTWLCQIAKHLLYQHWRKIKAHSFTEMDERLEALNDTEYEVINHIESEQIWDRINELPETMKQVMRLRLINELSFKEIGDILGKSENWARVNFYRGKMIVAKASK